MTYCLGIMTAEGLVLASDSRTNSGYDQVNVCRKLTTFIKPGERVFVLLSSGSLSLTQSIVTLLERDFEKGEGLAAAPSMYDAARIVGDQIRYISDVDRTALERDDFRFNVHFILAGQVGDQPHDLYLIYPQGNPLRATKDTPFLQIGEHKYGRPILVRGIRYDKTPLDEAAKYAIISMDSTMRSNVTVGPPIDLVVYHSGDLDILRQRRLTITDPNFVEMHSQWDLALRKAVQALPDVNFDVFGQLPAPTPEMVIDYPIPVSNGKSES